MTEARVIGAEVFRIGHPVRAVRAHGIGNIETAFETVIFRLEDEAGRVGWGEATPWAPFAGTPEAAFAALARYLGPVVVGSLPSLYAQTMDAGDAVLAGHTDAKAAVETALLDLLGQARGVPVWRLLGEKTRDAIPLSISIADPVWERDLELIDRAYAAGIRRFKLKAGFAEQGFDIKRIETVRARWPEAQIRLDYNQGLSVARAIEEVPKLDGMALEFIEQPVRAHEWAAMGALARVLKTPLLADESIFTSADFENAHGIVAADGVSVKIMKAGGPARGHALAAQAMKAGWQVYGGDMFETGISHLGGVHMIAASAGFGWGCEFYHANWHLKRDVLTERFAEANGAVIVPNGPGLGATVDEGFVRGTATDTATVGH